MKYQHRIQTRSSHLSDRCSFISSLVMVVIALLFTNHSLCAQAPKIQASIDTSELFIGESITYQVEIQNVENPTAPDLSPVEESFDVEFAGDQTQNQSSTFIINGRMTQKNSFSHIYLYKLTPKKSGKLVIPPVTTTVDGNQIQSNSVSLSIQDLEVQDVVVGQTVIEPKTVYPTQSFTVTLRIWIKGIPKSNEEPLSLLARRRLLPHLQVDWLKNMDGLKGEDMSEWLSSKLTRSGVGFTLNDVDTRSGSLFARAAVFQFLAGREGRPNADGETTDYFVYELPRTFTAEKPGVYTLGASMIKGTFITGIEGKEYVGRRIVALAPSESITVKEVPSPRPTGFIGGIGDYEVTAAANPSRLRVGDPLTLSLEFERAKNGGSLDLIAAPDLSQFPELSDAFEIVDSNPTGRIDSGRKKFAYALRPKRAGVTIPSLAFQSFDPVKEQFVLLETKAIPIDVAEASKMRTEDVVGNVGKGSDAATEIRSNEKGIYQIVTDLGQLRNDAVDERGRLLLVGTTWGLCGAAAFVMAWRRRQAQDTVGLRRQRAARVAHQRLKEAAKQESNPREMLRTIRSGLLGLVADTTNRMAEGLTSRDVAQLLKDAKASEAEQSQVIQLLAELDAAEYGAVSNLNVSETLQRAQTLIPVLAASLAKRSR
jgi:hypothetical protein